MGGDLCEVFLIAILIAGIGLNGCSNNENKLEIEEVISIFQDSLIQKDLEKLMTVIETHTELENRLSEHIFKDVDYIKFKILEKIVNEREVTIKLENDFRELSHNSNEYIPLKGILTIHLRNIKNSWLIYEMTTELAPGSTRPPQK